jgi:ABC-2 type transport system permease protein
MTPGYWVILRTEIFSLFISPATYVSTFYFLALLGVGFRFFIESFTGTNWILPPLSSLALGLLFGAPALIPFLTMRTIAEERRLGTLETLMTAPVNAVSIIAGKWSASYLFYLMICCGAYAYPLLVCIIFPEQAKSLGFYQLEHWIGGFTFLMSFGASFCAIGIFSSSITRNQMVAGMLSFSLITLYLAVMAFSYGEPSQVDQFNSYEDLFAMLGGSLYRGLDKIQFFALGVLHVPTILHQLIVVFFFLSLATLQIEKIRH